MMIGADGVLIVDPRPELEKPSLQVRPRGSVLGVVLGVVAVLADVLVLVLVGVLVVHVLVVHVLVVHVLVGEPQPVDPAAPLHMRPLR